jgi:hypothetical protein
MPFRDDETPREQTLDPLARFAELYAALEAHRRVLQDRVPLRLAAICLLTTPGPADQLALATRRIDAALDRRISWYHAFSESVRIVIAAQLHKHDDDPDSYMDEVVRVRSLFRAVGLRQGGAYEFLAVLVLRRVLARPVDRADVERFQAIYEALKRHHWWLTGPEDFPACAMLVARPEAPANIGAGTDAIYRALHRRADLWRGDPLQTAANVLYLADVPADELAERFALLMTGFRGRGVTIGQDQYDELAVLCFLAWPVDKIVEVVAEFRDRMRSTLPWLGRADALSLAANLAFVRLAGRDGLLGSLADLKPLLDMQAIVVARAGG